MIVDARVLRDEFVPREVVHRDAETNRLSAALSPLLDGEPAETALLTGPSGVGKTCIAQYTVSRLRERVLDIETQYVNCWQNYSRFRALYRILDGLGQTIDIHRQSTPRDELLERLERYDGPPCVVILDEVDQLEDMRILYDLYHLPRFSMILIANREEELFARLDDRIQSRLHTAERVHFDRYSVDELVAILEDRAESGLTTGAVAREQLAIIADAAAGDARVAIGILRNAARQAQRAESRAITYEMLHEAIPEGRAEVRRKSIETLTPHQRALYDILAEEGELEPADLYAAYQARVDEPKTDRTVRNYLQKLAQYNLITITGTSRDRTYVVERRE
ncbi:Cdc6/Cdc18 family protein [Halomarina halobia]|uniref:Cdc6/Cdc18 family protein n=1 Tax=Halomarina halobia TaxID=3033386 RepID=A0ABD6ADA4_9EURY|nr:Cdc6/Cdc18 family protein [Halomarina sp. PSR21]